ncbi:MAG TPA: hypothetical protein VL945_02720 [Candidatus Saccharimonadales bacterium]|nr:hypothetical protein [Candidatus Saccharimonadales bacterium]
MLYISETGVLTPGNPPSGEPAGSPQQFQPEPASPPQSQDFSRGEKCFNHPWRAAYARCSFCNRPFCYADLVDYEKKQYCLEDLGHATTTQTTVVFAANRFTYLASLLFVANAIIILYFNYPQFALLARQLLTLGPESFLLHMTFSSSVVLASLLFVVFGIALSFATFSNSTRVYFSSVFILLVMLLFFSYYYLSTTSTGAPNYFLYVSLALFANLLALALSRIGIIGRASQKAFADSVEWPRLETF